MKYVITFWLGALVGAAVALIFAPTSGEEMRSNIQTQANAQYTKAQDQVQKGISGMRARMGKSGNGNGDSVLELTESEEA